MYYYFVATLPSLSFEGRAPFSVDNFLKEAQQFLSAEHFCFLSESLIREEENMIEDPQFNRGVMGRWCAFIRNLRNEWAYFRSERAGVDKTKYLRGEKSFDPGLTDLLHQAGRLEDVLVAEKMIDRYRWNYLEDLSFSHQFDFDAVVVYGLKLKILARYDLFASPEGAKVISQLKSVAVLDTMEKLKSSRLN
jgi:hypothetical protein